MAHKISLFACMAALFAVLAANALSDWAFAYPFVYCTLKGPAWEVHQSIGSMALIVAAVLAAYFVFASRIFSAIGAVLFFVLVNNLPQLMANLLKEGGSCV